MYFNKVKIFDPRDPSTGTGGSELLDATVCKRDRAWQMYLAGQAAGYGPTDLFSASLPQCTQLSAQGWQLQRDAQGRLIPLAQRIGSAGWDGQGGRHCPSYVRGWDSRQSKWIERIYYAGAAENLWGPYTIGYLEWKHDRWEDQPAPVFVPQEEWERGSVYEPNLVYDEGLWKMWYVAGSNHDDYIVHGYSESDDGIHWEERRLFAPPELKMFDFHVAKTRDRFVAVFSRIWLQDERPPSSTGLWCCIANNASGNLNDWGAPVQIMTAANSGWHSGPWKPSLALCEDEKRACIFFDGSYRTDDPGPFPFAMTQGVIEIELSELTV